MSDLNKLKKILNNNNLAIPNLYFCGNYNNSNNNNEIINSTILNINDDKFNKLVDKNIIKKEEKKNRKTKKKHTKNNKKTKRKK